MSDEELETGFEESPTSRSGLRYSLGTLVEQFGRTDSAALGFLINGSIAAGGLALYSMTSGWLAGIGAIVALLSVAEILRWGLEQ